MSPQELAVLVSSLPADKIEHLTCTALLVIILHKVGVKPLWWAAFWALAAGVCKEFVDPVFDLGDVGADYIGMVLGVALCLF